jgi:hypothetical protein
MHVCYVNGMPAKSFVPLNNSNKRYTTVFQWRYTIEHFFLLEFDDLILSIFFLSIREEK